MRASKRTPTGRGERMGAALWRGAVSAGWLLSGLIGGSLGVLSCNSLLGIGEASLRCDTDPCATGVAGAATTPAGNAMNRDPEEGAPDASMAGIGTGAGGASNEGGIAGAPALQGSSGGSSSGGSSSSGPASASPDPPTGDSGSGGSSEPSSGGSTGDSSGSAGMGGAAPDPVATGGASALAQCNTGDACGACVCDACGDEFDACARTPGCLEIAACGRQNGCFGLDCFCGTIAAINCAVDGLGNGPCVEVTLAAPGAHAPTLLNPSAGPASDAAVDFGTCTVQNSCADACQN